jgi:aspartate dehydrogenase
MVTVGVVGCGTIGSALAHAIEREHRRTARLVALHDRDRAQALTLQRTLRSRPPIVSLAALIRRSRLVIEAASGAIASEVARAALRANRDVLIMSTGGLLASRSWLPLVRSSRGRLYLPSGALAGLDGVKALAVGKIRRIRLTTRKPPSALAQAPGVRTKRLRLDRLRRPRLLFEGSPREVVRAFPQNTNVAATLSLASGTADAMRVRVVADPTITTHRHEIEVEGDCGRIRCDIASRPSSRNPKTSEVAVRSALATLREILEPVRIGT